jgi:shikimate kinase
VKRHLVLLGLPGAGKSTVGRRAAALLGTGFTDTDDLVRAAAGRSIPEIFAQEGEAAFRRREREAMTRALGRPPHVIAAGGGWAAEPGNLEAARHGLTIYLSCNPRTAAIRTAGSADRPLLQGDRLAAIEALLDRRAPYYRKADAEIGTDDLGLEAVAERVAALARSKGGW